MAVQIKFGDVSVDKKEFYTNKSTVSLYDVNLDKIVVSNKWKVNETSCKYYVGYKDDTLIKPLCVILLQMTGYIKYFDDGNKNMSSISDYQVVYDNYAAIWSRVEKLLKLKFSVNPIRDDKYVCCKLKIFGENVWTTFSDNVIPVERQSYLCIAAIDIDSVLKVNKKVYPQVYLEQCKYKLKKSKPVDFIDIDIVDDESDSESELN